MQAHEESYTKLLPGCQLVTADTGMEMRLDRKGCVRSRSCLTFWLVCMTWYKSGYSVTQGIAERSQHAAPNPLGTLRKESGVGVGISAVVSAI